MQLERLQAKAQPQTRILLTLQKSLKPTKQQTPKSAKITIKLPQIQLLNRLIKLAARIKSQLRNQLTQHR